ncbi:MAG TPA: hypothetical protein VM263_10335 [Acidimicrobiales bacterium]|jgi:hypothetical protein|nr:hypothetical protein [Acidimicrobiales bacterium]
MPRRTNPPLDGVRLTTRLFPSRGRRQESAFAWLAADPVFDGVAATTD